MRTRQEIDQEYTNTCAVYGDLNFKLVRLGDTSELIKEELKKLFIKLSELNLEPAAAEIIATLTASINMMEYLQKYCDPTDKVLGSLLATSQRCVQKCLDGMSDDLKKTTLDGDFEIDRFEYAPLKNYDEIPEVAVAPIIESYPIPVEISDEETKLK